MKNQLGNVVPLLRVLLVPLMRILWVSLLIVHTTTEDSSGTTTESFSEISGSKRMSGLSCSSMPKYGNHSMSKSEKKKAYKARLSYRKQWEVQYPYCTDVTDLKEESSDWISEVKSIISSLDNDYSITIGSGYGSRSHANITDVSIYCTHDVLLEDIDWRFTGL